MEDGARWKMEQDGVWNKIEDGNKMEDRTR